MKTLVYDKSTRSFSVLHGDGVVKTYSPTLDRKSYKKRLRGFSQEFCHNVVRLILRPKHRSSKHWIQELRPWVRKSTIVNMTVPRSIIYLFDEFLREPDSETFDIDLIQTEVELVSNESYGPTKKLDLSDIIESITDLYNRLEKLIEDKKKPSIQEVDDTIDQWYSTLI